MNSGRSHHQSRGRRECFYVPMRSSEAKVEEFDQIGETIFPCYGVVLRNHSHAPMEFH